jgi:glutathionyl-hydroquinone reductase
MALAEMLCQQLKPQLATRNHYLELLPDNDKEKKEHGDLFKWIEHNVTTAVYRIARSGEVASHDVMVEKYYHALAKMQDRLLQNDNSSSLASSLAYLTGEKVRLADIILWISLVRLDLVYQFRFGLGKFYVREGMYRCGFCCFHLPSVDLDFNLSPSLFLTISYAHTLPHSLDVS